MTDPKNQDEYKKAKKAKRSLDKLGYIGNVSDNILGYNEEIINAIQTIREKFAITNYRVYKMLRFLIAKKKIAIKSMIPIYAGKHVQERVDNWINKKYYVYHGYTYIVSPNIYTIL